MGKWFRWMIAAMLVCGLVGGASAQQARFAKWSAALAPKDVRAGETAQIVVTVQLDAGWHLYSLTQPPGGPVKTTLTLNANSAVAAARAVQGKPKKVKDAAFNITTEIFEGKVAFAIPIKVKPGVSGKQTLTAHVEYMLCDEKNCLPTTRLDIPVTFTVSKGAARSNRTKPVLAAPKVSQVWYDFEMPRAGIRLTPTQDIQSAANAGAQEIAAAKRKGLGSFLTLAFWAGLLSLLTPCVFPMIPITVSFFLKRKDTPTGGLKGALAYSLGIIGTFTLLGIAVTLIFGATALARFAANPWVNLAFGILFVVLALNLLGVFELMLPPALANSVQSKRKQGSLAEPILMAVAFTLTSFTCTAPFVGTVLVSAAQGDYFYPAIGMLTYSIAFALPFFTLAMFPQMLVKLPRSGSWLVTVKGFMGFLELAAALKFFSNADFSWQAGLINRAAFLAIWFAIFLLAGLYLLGAVKLPHDDSKPGILRRVFGVGTIAAAMYFLLGIQGKPLDRIAGFPPPATYDSRWERTENSSVAGVATPAKEEKEVWHKTYAAGLAAAKQSGKPIFVDFTGYNCTNCRWMEENIFPKPEIKDALKNYVLVQLYVDGPDKASQENYSFQDKLTKTFTIPTYALVSPEGKLISVKQGQEPDVKKFEKFVRGETKDIASSR
jgi:thiol:disulfide interchange protein